jgi:hypothetical protein
MKSPRLWINAVFVFCLLAPGLQRWARIVREVSLQGAVEAAAFPTFGFRAWFDGSYANRCERAFNDSLGFRGHFVRTYNQAFLSLFGQPAPGRGTQVRIGRNDWLFEDVYVQHFMQGSRERDLAYLPKITQNLRRLQDELGRRGVGFVLVISPSKPEIYPEYLPSEIMARKRPPERRSSYEQFVPMLRESGVRMVDFHDDFLSRKHASPYPLFSVGGTHWNRYAAYVAVQEIFRALDPAQRRKVSVPAIDSVVLSRPRGAEKDLADLLNVWRTGSDRAPTPYPVVKPVTEASGRLNLLMVGDSFCFTLIDAMNQARMFNTLSLFYYNKSLYNFCGSGAERDYGKALKRRIAEGSINWETALLKNDAVILEVNEIAVQRVGWGFVEDALDALAALPPPAGPAL